MGQFERLLAYIKGMSRNTSEQGTWFENFMKHVFLTSPIYKEMYGCGQSFHIMEGVTTMA